MSIIGSVIKTAINTLDTFTSSPENVFKAQEEQLRKLLTSAKDTSFGKYYNFLHILDSDDMVKEYQNSVPIYTYENINERWWLNQQVNPDITWPGKPNFFAKSSGTTGKKSKRIPVTNDYISAVRSVGTSMIKDLSNFDFPTELFEKEIFMLSSSADLDENENGFLEGEISGINVSNFPDWYDTFYRPGKEIATIDDWDTRKAAIAKEAPNWDIGAIAGIPSWVLEVLKEIIKVNDLDNIHQIWPDFKVYASGGVAFETYRNSFDKLCGKNITVLDTYLASEGFIAYTARPNTMSMKLAIEHDLFFEFIPFNSSGFDESGNLLENPKVIAIDQVEENVDYALLVSTPSGAWRYMIGDTVTFTSVENYEIKITGRTKFFLNVVGSQLSEEKLDAAILKLASKYNVDINEYTVGAVKNEKDEYFHQWVLVTDDQLDSKLCESFLDKKLQEVNKNYKVARNKTLKGIEVTVISKEQYHGYLKAMKKNGGQIKTPKVMKEEKLKKYLEYLKG
ncbi:GH3 family domain-containing protein [Wenyingzhuangia sp. IMCC45533]